MSQPPFAPSTPPLLGLALGGGVARGWAHIGVLQRLQELGIRIDVVAGSSVGALVAGFWLAGKLDALADWARALNKRRMVNYFDLVLNGSGLISGRRLAATMRNYLGDLRIENLPSPFIAVATELATGHETWLRSGSLVDAIEASYSLPGIFPPRALDGRWLIDGALVNPLPVSACRALGARAVLAVGLHADVLARSGSRGRVANPDLVEPVELEEAARKSSMSERMMMRRLFHQDGAAPGLGSVMMASLTIVMDRVTRARLAGDPPDVQIIPQVGHLALLDFDRADEMIALGREAVDYSTPRIEAALSALGF